jgi:hypothetical protein
MERRIVELRRRHQLGPARLAPRVGLPASTFHRVFQRHGVSRLSDLDRKGGRIIRRIETTRPGELVHIDVKKQAEIPKGGGWRVNGRARKNYNGQRVAPPRLCLHPLGHRRPQPAGCTDGHHEAGNQSLALGPRNARVRRARSGPRRRTGKVASTERPGAARSPRSCRTALDPSRMSGRVTSAAHRLNASGKDWRGSSRTRALVEPSAALRASSPPTDCRRHLSGWAWVQLTWRSRPSQ